MRKINAFQVVVIEGETGCGKSTQVPQYILDEAVEENTHVNIVVTQPRRLAAISLANRVCQERSWVVGKLVGYQVFLFYSILNIVFNNVEVLLSCVSNISVVSFGYSNKIFLMIKLYNLNYLVAFK